MIKVRIRLKSVSQYSQSRPYIVEKLDKESNEDYEKRTWRERLHKTKDGEVFIPAIALKNCLADTAKYLGIQIKGKGKQTYTKHFEAGIMIFDNMLLGIKADEVDHVWILGNSKGQRRAPGPRVYKCFPIIHEWEAETFIYVLDQTITESVLKEHLDEAGKFIGLGTYRPINGGFQGRFEVVDFQWNVK